MNPIQIQQALASLGYYKGAIDGKLGKLSKAAIEKFQADFKLFVDGIAGQRTQGKLMELASSSSSPKIPPANGITVANGIIPSTWLPEARIKGLVLHWTAGRHKASMDDRKHYHILIEDDGKLIRGVPTIDLNSLPKAKPGYAAHTLNCNTGFIGVSMCAMALAEESPFKPGPAPLTRTQWETAPLVIAQLASKYGFKVTPQTVLTHAEVSKNLGIPQRGKWDVTRLAFDPSTIGAKACGDQMRAATLALL